MIIVHDHPPLWDLISAKFPIAGKPVIFAWGYMIFNPEGVVVSRDLHAHEEIHGMRQLEYMPALGKNKSIERWWHAYIGSPDFRLAEELPAHIAEYKSMCSWITDRNTRDQALHQVACKLASPLYGSLVTLQIARKLLMRSK